MRVKISDKVSASVESAKALNQGINLTAHWEWGHFRGGKLIDQWEYDNVCTDEGLDHVLDSTFDAATQITAWYAAIFEDDVIPDGDTTYAVPVFTESEAYDEATRPAYDPAAAASQVTTNVASKAVFTINATKTIYGAALVGGGTDGDTKGDVEGGGTLFSASKFGAAKNVVADDILNVTIAITLADS